MLRWTVHLEGLPETLPDAALAVDHKVYCFRGEPPTDVHVFNTVSLCWIKLPHPQTPGRGQRHIEVLCRTAVLIDPFIYIWGGMTGTWHNCTVLYAFDVDDQIMLTPVASGTAPKGRHGHSACVLGKVMFIYGGFTHKYTNDMYKLDTTTMVWSLINIRGTPMPASVSHSSTVIGTNMFVFGGFVFGGQDYNTIRVYDTETNHCLDTPSTQLVPEGRWGHSAFTYNGELYIFGGHNHKQYLNDIWKFSPETFSWKKVESKGKVPRVSTSKTIRSHMVCYCMVGGRMYLFVGHGSSHGTDVSILDLSPSLKTLCKLAVIQYGLEQSGLPHNIRWELAAMTTNSQ